MPIDFQVQNNNFSFQTNSTNFANKEVTGNLFGQQVVMSNDPMSLLADAAEELTFAADTTDDFELEERKEKESIEDKTAEMVKKYQELLQEAGDVDSANRLKESLANRTTDLVLKKFVMQMFSDISEGYANLQSAYEELKSEKADPKLLAEIETALTEMLTENGQEIRAGMHAVLSSHGFSDLGDYNTISSFYRTSVCDFTSINDLFKYVQDNYADNFDLALSFLYKTVANDLDSTCTSIEKNKLENINTNLGEMRSLQSAHSLCEKFLSRLDTVHDIKDCPIKTMQMLERIISFKDENYLGAMQIENFVDAIKTNDIEQKVLVLQELMNTARQFSVTLFGDTEGRMKVLSAVQQAVDNAITKEDEWLANQ